MVLDGNMADEGHRRASYGRIAYMPQGLGRNLYQSLSVFDNIDFFGRLLDRERPSGTRHRRALESEGLDPFGNRPCGKLSGGMKQKASLCCSLMHDPDLLVLDDDHGRGPALAAAVLGVDRLRSRAPPTDECARGNRLHG